VGRWSRAGCGGRVSEEVDRLRAAQRAGRLRPEVDPRIALELFVSPLAQRRLQYTGPISYEYTDTLVDYALHGLAPR
jgi:hypothetical protein